MFWSPECIFQVPNRGPPPTHPGEAGRPSWACRMGGPGPLWLPGGGEAGDWVSPVLWGLCSSDVLADFHNDVSFQAAFPARDCLSSDPICKYLFTDLRNLSLFCCMFSIFTLPNSVLRWYWPRLEISRNLETEKKVECDLKLINAATDVVVALCRALFKHFLDVNT